MKLITRILSRLHSIIKSPFRNHFTEITLTTNHHKILIPNNLAWAFPNGDYYEENVINFLDIIVKSYDKPVLIDVGANFGYYSVRYEHLCSHIFAFEPVSTTYNVLKKNIESNAVKNITLFKIGVSDTTGQQEINLYNVSGNNSLFARTVPDDHPLKKIGKETIKLNSLDILIKNGRVTIPDIIKIDVEGAELDVLKGAKNTIASHRPAIIFEYSESTSVDAGYTKEALLNVLELIDYHVYGIPEKEDDLTLIKEEDFARHDIANVIFVPKEHDPFTNVIG